MAECPGGVKPHGYVSLVKNGLFDEAMKLHLEDAPIVGSLGRACYAPCEKQCTRVDKEGAVNIKGIKRFLTDYYYKKYPEPQLETIEYRSTKKVAVVGSGPAGLTAAYFLARYGYKTDIYEAEQEAGGIYLFEDAASVKAYIEGPLAAQVTSHPALSDFSVKQFDVMEGVTAITRGPVK